MKVSSYIKRIMFPVYNCIFPRYKASKIKYAKKIFQVTGQHTFFGYYDISPFDSTSTKILFSSTKTPLRTPKPDDILAVGYFEIDNPNKAYQIGETTTWCWQQGCRLQWFPTGDAILFNKIVGGKYGAIVQDIKNKKIIKTFHKPIYSISRDGTNGLTLNFSRLQRLRPGYGYVNLPDNTITEKSPASEGIGLVNLNTGESKTIITVKDVTKLNPSPSMTNAEHYFNHLLFRPDGKRFLFMHLWLEGTKRYSRIITSDLEGRNLNIVTKENKASHYCWKNNQHILVYSSIQSKYGYYLYKDMSGEVRQVGKRVLLEDGHPSFMNNSQHIITDTYPNLGGQQYLLKYSAENNSAEVLLKCFSPRNFAGETRCDLHPRINENNNNISIDCIIEGKRVISLLSLL